jgi:hypothetical protein
LICTAAVDSNQVLVTVFFTGSRIFFGYHAATNWFPGSGRVGRPEEKSKLGHAGRTRPHGARGEGQLYGVKYGSGPGRSCLIVGN